MVRDSVFDNHLGMTLSLKGERMRSLVNGVAPLPDQLEVEKAIRKEFSDIGVRSDFTFTRFTLPLE